MTSILYRPKVYGASRSDLYKLWRTLREDPDWNFVEWTSSWPMNPEITDQDAVPEERFRELWIENLNEIRKSDFIMIYGRDTGAAPLRGALFEAGFAIACSIKIIAVGLDNGHSWTLLPPVTNVSNLIEARHHLYKYTVKAQR